MALMKICRHFERALAHIHTHMRTHAQFIAVMNLSLAADRKVICKTRLNAFCSLAAARTANASHALTDSLIHWRNLFEKKKFNKIIDAWMDDNNIMLSFIWYIMHWNTTSPLSDCYLDMVCMCGWVYLIWVKSQDIGFKDAIPSAVTTLSTLADCLKLRFRFHSRQMTSSNNEFRL